MVKYKVSVSHQSIVEADSFVEVLHGNSLVVSVEACRVFRPHLHRKETEQVLREFLVPNRVRVCDQHTCKQIIWSNIVNIDIFTCCMLLFNVFNIEQNGRGRVGI